jgi:hypothetical protein
MFNIVELILAHSDVVLSYSSSVFIIKFNYNNTLGKLKPFMHQYNLNFVFSSLWLLHFCTSHAKKKPTYDAQLFSHPIYFLTLQKWSGPYRQLSLTSSAAWYRIIQKRTVGKQTHHGEKKRGILIYKQDGSLKNQVKVGHRTTRNKTWL